MRETNLHLERHLRYKLYTDLPKLSTSHTYLNMYVYLINPIRTEIVVAITSSCNLISGWYCKIIYICRKIYNLLIAGKVAVTNLNLTIIHIVSLLSFRQQTWSRETFRPEIFRVQHLCNSGPGRLFKFALQIELPTETVFLLLASPLAVMKRQPEGRFSDWNSSSGEHMRLKR